MASSSSSAHNPQHHILFPHGTTAAPPPTPSSQPNLLSSTDSTADALASLLHRLPTTLSLPSSRFARRQTSSPGTNVAAGATRSDVPTVSLSQPSSDVLSAIASAASVQGFFQLTHHRVNSQLAESSESNSVSLLALSTVQKRRLFPANWPVGFDEDIETDEDPTGHENASFCLNLETLTAIKPAELSVGSLAELTRELECLGADVVEMLTCALGLENPFSGGKPEKKSSLMWVSKSDESSKAGMRCYPYAIGLSFQIGSQEYRLETDTGPVIVNPEVGSVLVTLGDISQVWSNGKTKKVRGRPTPIIQESGKDSISIWLLVTLPLDSTISPLFPVARTKENEDLIPNANKREVDGNEGGEKMVFKFNSIPFEDYAWRIYHETLFLKDSLDRYRILSD